MLPPCELRHHGYCLGLGPSSWCGDMVEWSVQKPGPDPAFPTFPSWLSQNGVSMGKVGDSLGMKVWRSADTVGLVSSASPSPGCRGFLVWPQQDQARGSKSKANSAAGSSRSLRDAELCLGPLGTTGSFVLLRPLPLFKTFPGALRCSGGRGKVEYSPPVRLGSHSLMPNPNFLSSLRGCGWA